MTLQNELLASGASATTVDVEAIIAQMQAQMAKQQDYIDKLLAERGIPTDPVAAQIQALVDHVAVQARANPLHDSSYSALRDYLSTVDSGNLNPVKARRILGHLRVLRAQHPGHELGYVQALADELHDMALGVEDDNATTATAPVTAKEAPAVTPVTAKEVGPVAQGVV